MEIIYGIYEHQQDILSDQNDNDNSDDVCLSYLLGIVCLTCVFIYVPWFLIALLMRRNFDLRICENQVKIFKIDGCQASPSNSHQKSHSFHHQHFSRTINLNLMMCINVKSRCDDNDQFQVPPFNSFLLFIEASSSFVNYCCYYESLIAFDDAWK